MPGRAAATIEKTAREARVGVAALDGSLVIEAAPRAVKERIDVFGEIGPTRTQRRAINHPALVVGHHNDPLHPFSDSGMVVEEMPGARLVEATSILEWRLNPGRLNEELARFLEEVYSEPAEMEALAGLFTGRPATSVWRKPSGAWVEW